MAKPDRQAEEILDLVRDMNLLGLPLR